MAVTIDRQDTIELGRNTHTQLIKYTWDAAAAPGDNDIWLTHDLDFDPLWVEVVECKADGVALANTRAPYARVNDAAPLTWVTQRVGNQWYVGLHFPDPGVGTTPTGFAKVHCGRTHSTSR